MQFEVDGLKQVAIALVLMGFGIASAMLLCLGIVQVKGEQWIKDHS